MNPITLSIRIALLGAVPAFFTSSCQTAHKPTIFSATIEGITVVLPQKESNSKQLIGPSPIMYDANSFATNVVEKPMEKGGKMTYMAPPWALKKPEVGIESYSVKAVLRQAAILKEYAIKNAYDTGYAFLINMSLKSGKKRFYVVNLQEMTIVNSGLVAHGRGEERFTFAKIFSNNLRSNCTSLGRYKIGKSYWGQFGLAYKLTGLDASNSNAQKRNVVLHSMSCISYEETTVPICQSEGCPAVSPQFLTEIKPVIDGRLKPMLLWVFNSTVKK